MKSTSKQEIAVCCITDKSKGFGNFSRSVTIAEAMREKGYKIVFIINRNKSAIQELKSRKFTYMLIPMFESAGDYSHQISRILNFRKCGTVIIDMREYGEQISKNLMNKHLKVILLDDAWCKKAYADIIFNGTMIKQNHQYKKINKASKIFVGPKYWIINREFGKHKKTLRDIYDKQKYSVVVSVGGSDPHELSLIVAKALQKIDNIKITIIIGPFFENSVKLNQFVKNKNNFSLIFSPKKIWNDFLKSDVVISGAGNTLFELSAQRIPTICIATAEHQKPYAKTFESKGFAKNLGFWKNVKKDLVRRTVIQILNDKLKRRKMSLAGSKILDGKQLLRVTEILEKNINKHSSQLNRG